MLVTLNAMKDFLGIPLATLTYDAFLTLQIQVVSEAIEGYCNRKFAEATYTQTFRRNDFQIVPLEIALYHFPLSSITSIVEKEEDADDGSPVTDYRFHLPTAKLHKNWGRFFANGKILEIEYIAGFATLPYLIQNVVFSLVQERYNKKINGVDLNFGSDVQRISIPGTISIDFDYSLNSNERKSAYGQILGNQINVLDGFRSERSLVGDVRVSYVS